jgi:hypothetical protein
MIAKVHETQNGKIIAVCDKEHLGKNFEEGKIFFTATKKFYEGKEVTEKELEKLLDDFWTANFFGNKCTEIAKRKGLITDSETISIKGIKHAQVYHI